MSESTPKIQTSLYLHWLLSLSQQEHTAASAQAALLAPPLAALLGELRQMHPEISVGVWLDALRRVWQDLEQELHDPQAAS